MLFMQLVQDRGRVRRRNHITSALDMYLPYKNFMNRIIISKDDL
jgi:hypothetical protein